MMERESESLWPLLALIVAVIALIVYVVANDRAATQHCIDAGYTVEECAWR